MGLAKILKIDDLILMDLFLLLNELSSLFSSLAL